MGLINENSVDNKFVKDGGTLNTRTDSSFVKFSAFKKERNLKSKDISSPNVCNKVQERVIPQDKLIKKRHMQSESPNVRNSGGYEYKIDMSDGLLLSSNINGQVRSNYHTRSKSPNVRITEVHQCEVNSINDTPSPDDFDSGQLGMRVRKNVILKTKSDSSCVTNSNEDEAIASPSSPPAFQARNLSQSAHVYRYNHTATPSPANNAETFHTNNALQEDRSSDDILACSSSIKSIHKFSSKDFYQILLKLEKKPQIDRLPMCSKWVKSLTNPDMLFSPGAYIHEENFDRLTYSNSSFDNISISEKAPESDVSFIARASSGSEGISAELQVSTTRCIKVSTIDAKYYT